MGYIKSETTEENMDYCKVEIRLKSERKEQNVEP